MATVTETTVAKAPEPLKADVIEPRFVIHGVPWALYDRMVEDLGESHVRMTYDRGTLELMSPSPEHDESGRAFGYLIEALAQARGMDLKNLGSTTFRRQILDKGLEPDECFFIANWKAVRGKKRLDLEVDPPPDLAIEVDITHSSLDRLKIYAALGVPEVWRYDGRQLTILELGEHRTYSEVERSPNFPEFRASDMTPWIARIRDESLTRSLRAFRAWARRHLRNRP